MRPKYTVKQVNLPGGIQVRKLRDSTFLKITNVPWEGTSFVFNLEASDTQFSVWI